MKKMSNALMILVGALFLTLLACSPAAHIEKDKNTDFSKYKTYSWMNNDRSGKSKVNTLAEQSIRDAVNEQLQKEGWREVRNQPDVLIGYDVLVERTTRETNNPVYSQPFTRMYYNPYMRRWGTLYYPSQFLGYDRDRYNTKESLALYVNIQRSDIRLRSHIKLS